jgi:hypothetical protein
VSDRVTYSSLFAVVLAICTLFAVAFSWHKETPHDGALSIQLFKGGMKHIDYRFDEIEKKLK